MHQHENLDFVTEMKIERPGNKIGHTFGENIQEDGPTQNKYVLDIPVQPTVVDQGESGPD